MSKTIIIKRCTKCKQIKPLSEFSKRIKSKDGHQNYCKICQNKLSKTYFQTEKGKITRKRYDRSKKGKAAHEYLRQTQKGKASQKRYRQSVKGKIGKRKRNVRYRIRHPEQWKAENALNYAVRLGKLPSPNTLQCYYCPKQADEYHHWHGYAIKHWLDVIPVCIKCHHLNPGYMNFQSA